LLRSSRHQGIAGHPSAHLSEHHFAAALAHVQANASASFSNLYSSMTSAPADRALLLVSVQALLQEPSSSPRSPIPLPLRGG
jgi:hypothetical protein